jgi:hypothetical protein
MDGFFLYIRLDFEKVNLVSFFQTTDFDTGMC